jgi:hypothetical protein
MFLGWTREGGHDYCVRQLRDMKGAADLENMNASELIDYAELCGWVLRPWSVWSNSTRPGIGRPRPPSGKRKAVTNWRTFTVT